MSKSRKLSEAVESTDSASAAVEPAIAKSDNENDRVVVFLRMPRKMRDELKAVADKHRLSLTQYCLHLIQNDISQNTRTRQ